MVVNKESDLIATIIAFVLVSLPAIFTAIFMWFLLLPQTFWEKLAYVIITIILVVLEYNIIAEVMSGELS